MREAMAHAEVGDDVYGEDPTVNKLEETAAEIMGKEAAVFVPTGTMGNLVSILSHCQRGQEVLLGDKSHVFFYERGNAAVVGGLPYHPLPNDRFGMLDPQEVINAVRGTDIHQPPTGLLCLENTHNRCGGTVLSVSQLETLCQIAHTRGLPVHLDGARIFNAALYLNCKVSEIAAEVDSVQFCLSKGLGAPVGSLVVGRQAFIGRVRANRKMVGGSMRQAGVLAAAGLIALTDMPLRLYEDHLNAQYLAENLNLIPGVEVDMATVQTNIVMADLDPAGPVAAHWSAQLKKVGVLVNAMGLYRLRFVTHYDVSRAEIETTLKAMAHLE
ncbi:MAG: low-specificity L-threonine aldolase [Chloroflexota bacterium]